MPYQADTHLCPVENRLSAVQVEWMFNREACLELTHNWGTEDDDSYRAHSGNEDPKGYHLI